MNTSCSRCGKTIAGEGAVFCPYCGTKLSTAGESQEATNAEAEKWIKKALASGSYPERKKILQAGLQACPGSREIEWELLFIGEEPRKQRGRFIDFSLIKCWILELYRNPGELPAEKKDAMRAQFFDAPELVRCLQRFDNPAEKQREYLDRICRDYIALFLEGSNLVMGNIFGLHIGRNPEKRLAMPVAEMIIRIRQDEKLSPDQREQLWKTLYQAYAARSGGNTEYLDEALDNR